MAWKDAIGIRDRKMDAVVYTDILETAFFHVMEEQYPNGMVLQKDGATEHTAKHTEDFSLLKGCLKWTGQLAILT